MAFFPQQFFLPTIGGHAAGYWEAARAHRLALQRCADCGAWRHPPAPVCWRCRSFNYEYAPVSGRGTVFSYTFVHQELMPELAGATPYNVVLVELEEVPDLRLVSNLIDTPDAEIRVGLPVEVVFEDITEEVTLPRFRRR